MQENNSPSSRKNEIINQLNIILSKYKKKEKQGVFFKLEKGKTPLEIIGVLDFLKYKFKAWKNTNIFSYTGELFDENKVLIIGASNFEDVIRIIMQIYLSEILDKSDKIDELVAMVGSFGDIEHYLKNKISNDVSEGKLEFETELKEHLEKLIKND